MELSKQLVFKTAVHILKMPVSEIKKLKTIKKEDIFRSTFFKKFRSSFLEYEGVHAILKNGDSVQCTKFYEDKNTDTAAQHIVCERLVKYDGGVFSIPLDLKYFSFLKKYNETH